MRSRLLFSLCWILLFAHCPSGCPTPPPPDPFRCSTDGQCASHYGWTCDRTLDICRGRCGRNQTDVDGMCLAQSGPGSLCEVDADCPIDSVCRTLDAPAAELPRRKICVDSVRPMACSGDTVGQCPDPSPSPLVDAVCANLASADSAMPPTESICVAQCFGATDGVSVSDPHVCRLDEVPVVTGTGTSASCHCMPRDPYGSACPRDGATCTGVAGWNGEPRECRLITADPLNLRCVDLGFCRVETLETCTNGVDEDCDGVAEANEPACQVQVCPDADHDGYCKATGCITAYIGAVPEGFSVADDNRNRHCTLEADSCDGDAALKPPFYPDPDAPMDRDMCFVCTNNLCTVSGVGVGCTCGPLYECNPDSLQCQKRL